MYLKSLKIINYRKFRDTDNTVEFMYANNYKDEVEVDISNKTTMIIGKNNSGKTTIINALKAIVKNESFSATDFNLEYLRELLKNYSQNNYEKLPTIEFKVIISLEKNKDDSLVNLMPFLKIDVTNQNEISINIKYSIKESLDFKEKLKNFIQKYNNISETNYMHKFLNFLNNEDFEISYYDSEEEQIKNFKLGNLVEIVCIEANKISKTQDLSSAFSKIINYKYNEIQKSLDDSEIDSNIDSINTALSEHIEENYSKSINRSIEKMILGKKCQMILRSDLTFKNLINNVIKYEYSEMGNSIPQNQFGLGYTNLMMIVAEIITYIEKFPNNSFNSHINLISIEEPETYMHPQMQELFIKNINEMINSILSENNKNINSQIIITTHSSHILNSKLVMASSFNNINYITSVKYKGKIIVLNDDTIKNGINDKISDKDKKFEFIKKHISYKIPELFFADATIFVEGITEYNLLQYYINLDSRLNKYYISLINISGAHSEIYEGLIKTLKIPTLIITDLDIKREKYEKGEKEEKEEKEENKSTEFLQITKDNINVRETTNKSLKYFSKKKTVSEIIENYIEIDNFMIVFQKDYIENYLPTSFEEAFILTNSKNEILKEVLKKIKPNIYNEIINNGGLVNNSFKLQKKLSDDKSKFASELLYRIITSETDEIPLLPKYINDGLEFLSRKLEEE